MMRCQKCPEVLGGDLKCPNCQAVLDKNDAETMIEKAFQDSEHLLRHQDQWTVENFEGYLSKYEKQFHPDHLLSIGIKCKLAGFYGKLPGYTITDLSKNRSLLGKNSTVGNLFTKTGSGNSGRLRSYHTIDIEKSQN